MLNIVYIYIHSLVVFFCVVCLCLLFVLVSVAFFLGVSRGVPSLVLVKKGFFVGLVGIILFWWQL